MGALRGRKEPSGPGGAGVRQLSPTKVQLENARFSPSRGGQAPGGAEILVKCAGGTRLGHQHRCKCKGSGPGLGAGDAGRDQAEGGPALGWAAYSTHTHGAQRRALCSSNCPGVFHFADVDCHVDSESARSFRRLLWPRTPPHAASPAPHTWWGGAPAAQGGFHAWAPQLTSHDLEEVGTHPCTQPHAGPLSGRDSRHWRHQLACGCSAHGVTFSAYGRACGSPWKSPHGRMSSLTGQPRHASEGEAGP